MFCLANPIQVNSEGRARVFGSEASLWKAFDVGLTLRAMLSWAWGDGPDIGGEPGAPRVPLSRIPPPTGAFEVTYRHFETGLLGGLALRWAGAQSRLAPSDASDARIPVGGTRVWSSRRALCGATVQALESGLFGRMF